MGKKTYKKLGDYIELVWGRNDDLAITKLMGISTAKHFLPSIANTIGTNMSNYKVVRHNDFVYVPDTSRRGDKIAIAKYNEQDDCIVSQAYTPFRVIDENELNPDYLMMWFRRPEFDRYARFHSHGSVREIFSWEDMCNVSLPIPDIDEQRKIVAEYQTIEKRIENNNRLIHALEQTAQNIYHHMFVENIDPENLPDGWNVTTIENYFGKVTIGKTPPREKADCFVTDGSGIKWVSIADMKTVSPFIVFTSECLTDRAILDYKVKVVPKNTILLSFKMTVGRVSITTEDMCTNEAIAHLVCKDKAQLAYTYFYLKDFDYTKLGNTSSISDAVNSKIIKQMKFVKPIDECMMKFAEKVSPILDIEYLIAKENMQLQKAMNFLLSKLS